MTFLADYRHRGWRYCLEFDCASWDLAEDICRAQGWLLLGEKQDSVRAPDDVIALIERNVTSAVVH